MSKALPWVLNLTGGGGGGGTVTNPVPDDVIFITADNSTITEDFTDGEVYTIVNEKLYNAISSEDNFRVMFVNTGTDLDKYTTSIENNIDTETSRLITFNYVDETKDFILEQGEGTNECILTMDFNRYFAIGNKANDNVSDRLHYLGKTSEHSSAGTALDLTNLQKGLYLMYNDVTAPSTKGPYYTPYTYFKIIKNGVTTIIDKKLNSNNAGQIQPFIIFIEVVTAVKDVIIPSSGRSADFIFITYNNILNNGNLNWSGIGIQFNSDSTTYAHSGSGIPGFSTTNTVGCYAAFMTNFDQTFDGKKTFNTIPEIKNTLTPTTDYQLVNKKYVDDNAGGGEPSFLPLEITYTEVLQGLTLTNVNVAYTSNSHDNLLAILNVKAKGQECLGYSTHNQQTWIRTAIYNLTETANTDNYIAFTLGAVVPYITMRYYDSGSLNTKPRVRVSSTIYVKKSEWTAGEILEIYDDSACTNPMSTTTWLGKDVINECVIPSTGVSMAGFMSQCLGYDGTKRQYLTHDAGSGNMTWVDIT